MSGHSVRALQPGDEPGWRALWEDYLGFYQVTLAPAITDATWSRLTDPASPLQGRAAVDARGQVLGFALFHRHLSTWVAGDDIYLEDLFVSDAARGQGIGRALIDDLIGLARSSGAHRFYWHTDEKNARARALYDSYAPADGHIRYRLTL